MVALQSWSGGEKWRSPPGRVSPSRAHVHRAVMTKRPQNDGVLQIIVPGAEFKGRFTLLMERLIIDALTECATLTGARGIMTRDSGTPSGASWKGPRPGAGNATTQACARRDGEIVHDRFHIMKHVSEAADERGAPRATRKRHTRATPPRVALRGQGRGSFTRRSPHTPDPLRRLEN